MGWRALTLAPVPGDASSVQMSLYLAAHDPVGRLKMMPSTAALTLAASQQTQGALLRVVSVPDSLLNSNPSNFSLPHPVVLATTTGANSKLPGDFSAFLIARTRSGQTQRKESAPKKGMFTQVIGGTRARSTAIGLYPRAMQPGQRVVRCTLRWRAVTCLSGP